MNYIGDLVKYIGDLVNYIGKHGILIKKSYDLQSIGCTIEYSK